MCLYDDIPTLSSYLETLQPSWRDKIRNRLDESRVLAIRKRCDAGESIKSVAISENLNYSHVRSVFLRTIWKHI